LIPYLSLVHVVISYLSLVSVLSWVPRAEGEGQQLRP
jgi:hypothetical protein